MPSTITTTWLVLLCFVQLNTCYPVSLYYNGVNRMTRYSPRYAESPPQYNSEMTDQLSKAIREIFRRQQLTKYSPFFVSNTISSPNNAQQQKRFYDDAGFHGVGKRSVKSPLEWKTGSRMDERMQQIIIRIILIGVCLRIAWFFSLVDANFWIWWCLGYTNDMSLY